MPLYSVLAGTTKTLLDRVNKYDFVDAISVGPAPILCELTYYRYTVNIASSYKYNRYNKGYNRYKRYKKGYRARYNLIYPSIRYVR